VSQLPLNLKGDICANYHGGAKASVKAHQGTPPEVRETQKRLVYLTILRSRDRGMTCDQVEQATGLPHQTASARMTNLKAENKIYETGEERPTRTGSPAAVCKVVNE
jgi:hypothetical protein